jgi:hypothetical protein
MTKHHDSLCSSRHLLRPYVGNFLCSTAIGRMVGSHWPCCGACGAGSIASLTKSRRAKQIGLDTCYSQCLFFSHTVRLLPSALTSCPEVMTVPCFAISSNGRTLTKICAFSPDRQPGPASCISQSPPIAVPTLSLPQIPSHQQATETIDHSHTPLPILSRRPTNHSNTIP